nr:DUF1819 family protein [Rhodospirillales bacterium]
MPKGLTMSAQAYAGDLNGGSLLLGDSRKVAELLLIVKSQEQWNLEIASNNILQRNSIHTALRTAKTIRSRLEPLGPQYIEAVVASYDRDYIQLLMAALMIHSPIVVDFMRGPMTETSRVYKNELTRPMWFEFFDEQVRRYPELTKYSEGTIKKMGKNIFRALAEAGYIETPRKKKLQTVYASDDVTDILEQIDRKDIAAALNFIL